MSPEANDASDESDDDHYDKIAEAPKLPNPQPPPLPPPTISESEPKKRLTKRDSAPAAAASPSKGKSSPTRNLANRCDTCVCLLELLICSSHRIISMQYVLSSFTSERLREPVNLMSWFHLVSSARFPQPLGAEFAENTIFTFSRSPEHQRVGRGRQRRPDAGAVGASPPKANVEKAVVFRRASDKNGGEQSNTSGGKSYNIQQVISILNHLTQ